MSGTAAEQVRSIVAVEAIEDKEETPKRKRS